MTPELSRRGFLTLALAASCAPAIVRASSLMPIVPPPDWRDYVREVYSWDIANRQWYLRYDIKAGDFQPHMEAAIRPRFRPPGTPYEPNPPYEQFKAASLATLRDALIHQNISPYSLQHLELPRAQGWAKRGVR